MTPTKTSKQALAAQLDDTLAGTKSTKPKAVTPVHKPVRTTLDLEPTLYRRLMSLCSDIALAIGRPQVKQVWVMREMLLETLDNKEFQAKVTERVLATIEETEAAKGKKK